MTELKKERKQIENRADVSLLVRSFYAKVRQNELLGPIFNNIISDWEEHLEKLTDFWENNLFFIKKYYGNPKKAHIDVDQKMDNIIESKHFGEWLNLWYKTIDENFEGQLADRAKMNARKMSTHLFLKIYENRWKLFKPNKILYF